MLSSVNKIKLRMMARNHGIPTQGIDYFNMTVRIVDNSTTITSEERTVLEAVCRHLKIELKDIEKGKN